MTKSNPPTLKKKKQEKGKGKGEGEGKRKENQGIEVLTLNNLQVQPEHTHFILLAADMDNNPSFIYHK